MQHGIRWITAAIISILTAQVTLAIELGDSAPPLKIATWVKGGPVDLKAGKGKSIYVVEFWATWCPPCRTSIPHLTELQKKYKDKGVVVIGVSDEEAPVIKPFVDKMGDSMNYIVAADDGGKTGQAYMQAFGITSIPHAFIVDKTGAIVWEGGISGRFDQALEQVVNGKYDLDAAKNYTRAMKVGDQYFDLLANPNGEHAKLSPKDKEKKAKELGEQFLKLAAKNPDLLAMFARTVLTAEWLKNKDKDLAMKAAKAAYDGNKNNDPIVFDAYAKALFETGKKTEAIAAQKKAIEVCKDAELLEYLKKTLAQYEQGGEKKADKGSEAK